MPPKFFITHSWHDIEFAKQFTDAMRGAGLDGFFDAYSLYPGDVVTAEIQKGLEACDVYVPILSDAALRSPWCEEEINAAITLSKLPGRNGRPRIIPVLVEPVQDRMSIFLRARLFVRFEDNFQHSFQEFWRGVMVTPTTDSAPPPFQPNTSSQPAAPEPNRRERSSQRSEPQPVEAVEREDVRSVQEPPKIETSSRAIVALPRDEMALVYNEGRALQSSGDLRGAHSAFQKVFESASDYRDVSARFTKLDLYLSASALMEQGFADQEDKPAYWEQAVARWQELVLLDANFLDAPMKLQISQRWLDLPEVYEKLLDALDTDDWKAAYPLFEQIRSVKPTYLKTQQLYERAWGEFVRAGLTKKVNPKDGKEMLLIPAGEFLMGSSDADKDAQPNEKPQHTVYLDAFYISRYPVTNAEYKKFKSDWKIPNGKENHPVVNVNWNDAAAYCKWLSEQAVDRETGKQVKFRLPTEAEWEKAASWDDAKSIKRVYPWSDVFDKNKCNSSEAGIGDTTPVGKYSPQGDSFYGVSDMAGNVWEWCADWFDENYYKSAPRENPRNDSPGQYRVLRGGSFYYAAPNARCARRDGNPPDDLDRNIGFRVVAAPVDSGL